MESKTHKLFVYGSLMRGFEGFDLYMQNAKFICNAAVNGELRYSFSDYPVLIADENKEEYVFGELYEVDDDTLNKIRKYEGSDSFLTYYTEKDINVKKGNDTLNAKAFVVSPYKKFPLKFLTFKVPGGNWRKFIDSKRKIPLPKSVFIIVGFVLLAGFAWELFHYFNLEKYLM